MQERTLSKFDRAVAGLQGGNNLPSKPTTIQHIEPNTGAMETFTVQTVRAEYETMVTNRKTGKREKQTKVGDYIILTFFDQDGLARLVLPPEVTNTIANHSVALSKKARTIASKNAMQERMANGFVPTFQKK